MWRDGAVSVGVKGRVYSAVVRTGWAMRPRRAEPDPSRAEPRPARLADVRAVEVFDRWCLRRVVWGRLMDRVGLRGMGELLVERGWRWLGHVLRMGPDRLPRKCLVVGDMLAEEGARRGVLDRG